jgi:hypothetical protein
VPPESTDAYFTYPEVRDLDVALERLHAASRAVDVAVRSMSAQAVEKSYEELHASVEAHWKTTQRILSASKARAAR